jgi:glycosyltransferase involved in cell wall biosynthesis
MKILIISDAWTPQINGVVRTYEHICEELEKIGQEVYVIGPSDFPRRMPMPGYREIELVIAPYRRLKRKIEELESNSPVSIHIATEGPLGRAARRYCLKHGHSFTTAYHTQFPDYIAKRVERFLPFMAEWVKEFATNIIRHFHAPSSAMMFTTERMQQELNERGFKAPKHALKRGVHIDRFYPGESSLFDDLQRPIALYVGRIAVEKNLEDFLGMVWDGSKVIVGDGPDLAALQEKYSKVVFAGRKIGEELAAHYRSADIFVFPSRTDTFGIVLLEALASGLPIAAYDVTGPGDIITVPFLGCLHEDDLAHAAGKALEHKGSAAERHEHVKEHYSWANIAKQFLDIQKEATG